MDKDEQIFIMLEVDKPPIEFLLTEQPLKMIRATFVSKNEIRDTVETGFTSDHIMYYKTSYLDEVDLLATLMIRVDYTLKTIEEVEKLIN